MRRATLSPMALLLALGGCTSPEAAEAPIWPDSRVTFGSNDATDAASDDGATEADATTSADTTTTYSASDAGLVDGMLPSCGDQRVTLGAVERASVLVVLDRSGSMANGKWDQAQDALSVVLEEFDPYVYFSLLLYPQQPHQCALTPVPHVGFALHNANTIIQTMQAQGTSNGTPTGGALRASVGILENYAPTSIRALVIATDGSPSCSADCSTCANCYTEDACIEHEIEETVTQLSNMGVPTYVIGIAGSGEAATLLDTMATLGGTAKAGSPAYYDTTSGTDLTDAMSEIIEGVGSCSVQLDPVPGYISLVIEVDGATIPRDLTHLDGWDLLDGDVLQFYGDACEIAAASGADVSVTYTCKYAF